jgi:hypothetical protein
LANSRRTAAVVGLLAALVLATGSVTIRSVYGVWSPLEPPARLELCDQNYTRFTEDRWSLEQAVARDPEARTAIVATATFGALPLGLRAPPRFEPGAGYNGCGHLLLLKLAADSYVPYYKLGGP